MMNTIVELNRGEIGIISGGVVQLSDEQKKCLDTAFGLVIFAGGGALARTFPSGALLLSFGAGMIAFWAVPEISRYFAETAKERSKIA